MRDGTADAPHAFGCCGLSGKVFSLQELVEYTDGLPGRVERRADLARGKCVCIKFRRALLRIATASRLDRDIPCFGRGHVPSVSAIAV